MHSMHDHPKATDELRAKSPELQAEVRSMIADGIKVEACLACADRYKATEDQRKTGIRTGLRAALPPGGAGGHGASGHAWRPRFLPAESGKGGANGAAAAGAR
jgi:hypothetical protein